MNFCACSAAPSDSAVILPAHCKTCSTLLIKSMQTMLQEAAYEKYLSYSTVR